jgi:hypothetical protein
MDDYSERDTENRILVEIESDTTERLYYHKDTKVMYVQLGYGVTVLLNADGTPMIYDES